MSGNFETRSAFWFSAFRKPRRAIEDRIREIVREEIRASNAEILAGLPDTTWGARPFDPVRTARESWDLRDIERSDRRDGFHLAMGTVKGPGQPNKAVHTVIAAALAETHRLASEARLDANSTIKSKVSASDGNRDLSTEAMSLYGDAAANTALTDISLPSSARESAMTVAYNSTSSSEEPSAKVSILKKLTASLLRLKARLCRESGKDGKP